MPIEASDREWLQTMRERFFEMARAQDPNAMPHMIDATPGQGDQA